MNRYECVSAGVFCKTGCSALDKMAIDEVQFDGSPCGILEAVEVGR